MPDTLQQPKVIVPDSSQEGIVGQIVPMDTMKVVKKEMPIVGVEEKPAAYKAATDDMLSASLLIMVVVALLALSASWGFIVRQCRNFFYRENERTTNTPDTNNEIRSQMVLMVFAAFIFAVVYYAYFTNVNDVRALNVSNKLLLLLYVGAFVGYMLMKTGLYVLVNWVFFNGKEIEQWNKSQLLINTMEGLLLAPVSLLFVYGKLSLQTMLICIGFVVILCKLCTFYKCYLIFFKRFAAFLQIILYFCALELIPLAALVGFLEAYNENSIINF